MESTDLVQFRPAKFFMAFLRIYGIMSSDILRRPGPLGERQAAQPGRVHP